MYSKKATPILVLDFFQANLFYFILKMSTLKGVQAWPQQFLCSSSLERWFTCATPCLRRWCVSYSPRLIKGIYGAKKIINNFFSLQFSSSMIGRRVSVPLCSNIWYLKQASLLLPVMSCFSLSISFVHLSVHIDWLPLCEWTKKESVGISSQRSRMEESWDCSLFTTSFYHVLSIS